MRDTFLLLTLVSFNSFFLSCEQNSGERKYMNTMKQEPSVNSVITADTATFGAGCFWCIEAQFQLLEGVLSVTSGFSGGRTTNPSYDEVCSGETGHAEVIQIVFDSSKISYDELLAAFWQAHDPTQVNRQGNDIGTQYRSVIFYHNEKQKNLAEKYKKELNDSGAWDKPVITEISPFSGLYRAEDYHQDYFNKNRNQAYCQIVIQPKMEKFKNVFKSKLKNKLK